MHALMRCDATQRPWSLGYCVGLPHTEIRYWRARLFGAQAPRRFKRRALFGHCWKMLVFLPKARKAAVVCYAVEARERLRGEEQGLRNKIDVFLAAGEPALLASKEKGENIPIVVVSCDPLEKLLGSLARPGGNATGFTCGHLEKLLSMRIACGSGVNVHESERERSGIICRQFCGVG